MTTWTKYTHNPFMTKADVLRDFNENVKPSVIAHYGRNDRVALAEAWNAKAAVREQYPDARFYS